MNRIETNKMLNNTIEDAVLDDPRDYIADPGEYDLGKSGPELDKYIEDIADTVRIGLDQSIAILTPWFFNNMPTIYYATTPRAEKVRHLSAVITGHVFETKQTVELWDRDRSKVTYIGPGGDKEILNDMAKRVDLLKVKMGSVYFSRDNLLFLSTFLKSDYKAIDTNNPIITDKIEKSRKQLLAEFPNDKDQIDKYLADLDNDFIIYATASRLQVTYRMYRHMATHEGAVTVYEPFENSPAARLSIGIRSNISEVSEQVLSLISRYGLNIVRAFLITFEKNLSEPYTIMHFVIKNANSNQHLNEIEIKKLTKALQTLGWVDKDEYSELTKKSDVFSIGAANLIRSMATWVHVLLGKENKDYYSEYKIRATFFAFQEITEDLVSLFRLKFDPMKAVERDAGQFEEFKKTVKAKIKEIVDPIERQIFRECVKFIDHILKTNYFIQTKTGLAFRLDPGLLDPTYYPNKPFGIFFIVGRDYRMFQIRWKDIARGGLRIVMPRSRSEHNFSLSGLFDETYGLSYAQQLKNKDIPEGGSKAVLLLKPGGNKTRAVRGAINAMLDLLVTEDEIKEKLASKVISYYKDEEIIYLGPDENMTNDLIEWVPQQAAKRGYRYAQAFMSSKPNAGINHKQYGVTSEGLNVFLEEALKFLKIDPRKEKFTIKMTGGPDGDVAGNELKILHREFGENARVVAIGDGFGAAYDPNGLDWSELIRLFKAGESISKFNPAKLSKASDAYVILADTSENMRKRNELHASVKADILIPAGGRPYTVNGKNWNKFLDENGNLSCRAIVEGANIFFTPEAREKLQEKGMIVVKDSSANKTGVICSSFEIIASLLLSEQEFADIKETYVNQVIGILRTKAYLEAKLLFAEYLESGFKKNLVELSMEISKEINSVTDLVLDELNKDRKAALNDPLYRSILERHCPQIMRDKYLDRIHKGLPEAHQIAIISAYIASHIVYNEGLNWVKSLDDSSKFKAIITYFKQDAMTAKLVDEVEKSNIKDKERIKAILKMSATRDLTIMEMSSSHGE